MHTTIHFDEVCYCIVMYSLNFNSRFERHILFPKLLANNAEDYNGSNTMYNRDPSKCGTARRLVILVVTY